MNIMQVKYNCYVKKLVQNDRNNRVKSTIITYSNMSKCSWQPVLYFSQSKKCKPLIENGQFNLFNCLI